jgi:hypothetical protein
VVVGQVGREQAEEADDDGGRRGQDGQPVHAGRGHLVGQPDGQQGDQPEQGAAVGEQQQDGRHDHGDQQEGGVDVVEHADGVEQGPARPGHPDLEVAVAPADRLADVLDPAEQLLGVAGGQRDGVQQRRAVLGGTGGDPRRRRCSASARVDSALLGRKLAASFSWTD